MPALGRTPKFAKVRIPWSELVAVRVWGRRSSPSIGVLRTNSDETLYFRSYDNLDESCTWVSRLISRDQPERLIKSNAVSLYEDDTGPGEQA